MRALSSYTLPLSAGGSGGGVRAPSTPPHPPSASAAATRSSPAERKPAIDQLLMKWLGRGSIRLLLGPSGRGRRRGCARIAHLVAEGNARDFILTQKRVLLRLLQARPVHAQGEA